DTIREFGRRAFRRPLSVEETDRFEKLLDQAPDSTPTGAPSEIAELLLNAFLISPSFLLRPELEASTTPDGAFTLSNHEVASRLSYLVYGSMPDPELMAAADAGELVSRAQILEQAHRMLQNEKSRPQLVEMHRYYTGLGSPNTRWGQTDHDPDLFPLYKPGTKAVMRQELESFFETI